MSTFVISNPPYDVTEDPIGLALSHAAAEGGGKVIVPNGRWPIFTTLPGESNITLEGEGPGSVIAAQGDGFAALHLSGALGPSSPLVRDGDDFAGAITLASVSAAELTLGDLIVISDTAGRSQTTYVTDVSSTLNRVWLADPLYETFRVAEDALATKLIPKDGMRIKSLTFDGTGLGNTSGPARGVLFSRVRDCLIDDVRFVGFKDAALMLTTGYGNVLRQINAQGCGSADEASVLFDRQTGGEVNGLLDVRATGFGPQLTRSNGNVWSNVRSVDAAGRGMKFNQASHNIFSNIAVVRAGLTGLSIALGSRQNRINGLTTIDCAESGIWFSGPGDDQNIILGALSYGNGDYNLAFHEGTRGNVVVGDISQNGLGMLIRGFNNSCVPLTARVGWLVMAGGTMSG